MMNICFNEDIITANLAHFKNDRNGKNQNTYRVPPLSTVVGILKNIYGEDISDFVFGYTCSYDGTFTDVTRVYKEINPRARELTDADRFNKDICFIEYLVNPMIKIYTTIDKEVELTKTLNLGKTNCLAKRSFHKGVKIKKQNSIGYNQWTDLKTGEGEIKRINKETKYNETKGIYDYYTILARLNDEFESEYTIEETNEGIYLWKYKKVGEIECYQDCI